jgi:hypothetical protein
MRLDYEFGCGSLAGNNHGVASGFADDKDCLLAR